MSDGTQGGGGAAAELLGEAAAGAGAGEGAGGGEAGAGGDGGEGGADPDWYASLSTEVPEGEKSSLFDFVKARGAKTVDQLAQG
ncbi:MAG: hypothetical protein K2W91_14795, partial [Novosphingobium sp.]|nr:hypothetical protein [Novosphingobium sp.]